MKILIGSIALSVALLAPTTGLRLVERWIVGLR